MQVTEHRVGTVDERQRLASIDMDTAHATVPQGGDVPASITVMASSPGLKSASVVIPVSANALLHGVLPAATRSFESEQDWE